MRLALHPLLFLLDARVDGIKLAEQFLRRTTAVHVDHLLVGDHVKHGVLDHQGNSRFRVRRHDVRYHRAVHPPGELELAAHHVGGGERVAPFADQQHFPVRHPGGFRRDFKSFLRPAKREGRQYHSY